MYNNKFDKKIYKKIYFTNFGFSYIWIRISEISDSDSENHYPKFGYPDLDTTEENRYIFWNKSQKVGLLANFKFHKLSPKKYIIDLYYFILMTISGNK